jgi:DNA mismatch repair protein MutS2
MGFDHDTLEPTYRLRLGAPGESAGLAIASRLGMASDLIEKARAAMTHRERDLADFREQLQQKVNALQHEREQLETQRLALEAREKAVASEWAQRESAKLRELEKKCELLAQAFEESSRQTIAGIMETAQQRKSAEQAQRKVSKTVREFREELQSTLAAAKPGVVSAPLTQQIEEGCRVRLKNMRDLARVKRRIGADRLEVEAGFMKMQVSVDDVLEVFPEGASGPAKLPQNGSFQSAGPRWDVSYRELNLIGRRAEEALEEVDKFLDHAVMTGVNRVRIVHGHGMGILKKAVHEMLHEMLSKHPHVATHYAATPAEGGTGATIAEIREE